MSKNIETVLAILKDEVLGDVSAALEKMTQDYVMTWMYQGKEDLFPTSKKDFQSEIKEIYPIKGRRYQIKNIAEGADVVMVELIESYPDSQTGTLHQTPLVLVLEMEGDKIKTGRHYCDPVISYKNLSTQELDAAYRNKPNKLVIE